MHLLTPETGIKPRASCGAVEVTGVNRSNQTHCPESKYNLRKVINLTSYGQNQSEHISQFKKTGI